MIALTVQDINAAWIILAAVLIASGVGITQVIRWGIADRRDEKAARKAERIVTSPLLESDYSPDLALAQHTKAGLDRLHAAVQAERVAQLNTRTEEWDAILLAGEQIAADCTVVPIRKAGLL
ncbi:MAG: hypothetical protein JWP74_1719 [Marmoricola sp.]|nr:hypothetical protein [Marmoricola sp.]